ncbi:hypothetical protein BCR36DRAFT_416725 [Piromyces finnis]|uniref:Uncharacterized protein n=1 Tax=Piromyces finnis TaxID=1754191 RepID=A0A1Y1UVA0_9FUNG|nr:hypothetical protein BCR36DRAFT_416725 [Piromyces finnis]|eukprot:ORX41515.1 hypothetical protein BCR36DRAFT_416725 [Piromyces finnis]
MEDTFQASRCSLYRIEKDNYIWVEYISQIGYSIGHTLIYLFLLLLSLWSFLKAIKNKKLCKPNLNEIPFIRFYKYFITFLFSIFFLEVLTICIVYDHNNSNFIFMIFWVKVAFLIMIFIWLITSIGLLFLGYFFILKPNNHDTTTIQVMNPNYQQETILVQNYLNKIQYQQLKSNWTKFTFQEYLIGSLLSIVVIIPVTILLLSTSISIGLPYSLTTLISIITFLHLVWGIFDIYDTTTHSNVYIRIFFGSVITSGLAIPLYCIPQIYHLVYSEFSTVTNTIVILLSTYVRGILGYKLYPMEDFHLRDLLSHPNTESDQYKSNNHFSQPFYQSSKPLQYKKTVSNVNQMKQFEFFTNYCYQNTNILNSFYDDGIENNRSSQYQSPSTLKYGYTSTISNPYLYQPSSRELMDEDDIHQYNINTISANPFSTSVQAFENNNSNNEEYGEDSIHFIQVMRVSCIFFGLYYIILNILYGSTSYMSVALITFIIFYYSDIFKTIEKLKGKFIFWSTLLSITLILLFLVNLPFFFHKKQFPGLIMRIDQSLVDELPLLNRTTVNGFYIQNQTVSEVYFDKKYYHLVNKVKIQGHISLDYPKNTYHLSNLYDNYSLNNTELITTVHDYYDWYYTTFNNTNILLSEKMSYADNTIQLNYPHAPKRYYLYVDTVLLNPWLVETIHARGKEVYVLFSEETKVGRLSIPSKKKTLKMYDGIRASELDEATQYLKDNINDLDSKASNKTNTSKYKKKKAKKPKERKIKIYNNENKIFIKLMTYLQVDTLVVKNINNVQKILKQTFSKPVIPGDQINIFNQTLPGEELPSSEKHHSKPGYYPDMSNKPHNASGNGTNDKSKDFDLEKEKWAITIISVSMSYLVFSSVYIGFNIKKVSTTSYSYYRKQLRQSYHDPHQDLTTIMNYHEKKMLSIFIECIAALGWLFYVIGWGNNKALLVIPLPHFLYILGFLGLLSCILFITVTIATHHILVSILHCAVEILVILSAGAVYHQVYLYYSHTSSLKIVLIGVIIYASCKILSVGIYMFRWKRSTLENDLVIVIALFISFIGSIAFLIGFGRINLVYHVFNSFNYLLYYIFSVVSILSVIFQVYSCLQSIKFVNSLTSVFLLIAIFTSGGPLTDSFYSITRHCKYIEEDFLSATLFTIIPGCSYQHQFILAGLLIFIIGETICFFYHHCYPIYESAARQYKNYKEKFLLNHDVASINRDDPQFSVFKHIKKKGWLNSLFTILCIIIVLTSIICLIIYALSPHSYTMVFNISCVTYTLAGIFYPLLLYFVISRNNRFCFIICETLYLFTLVTSGYITFWCMIHLKSLNKAFVFLFLFSFIFLFCLVSVHSISHLYLHHFTNSLQKSLLFMIKLLSLVGLVLFTVGICRQYQKLLSSELIPGVLLMIFGLLSLICWFEYVVIQIVSLNLFSSLFISVSLICCGFFILSSFSEIANSVNHLLKYIGVLIYCIPIFVSEIFRCWKGSSYKASIIKTTSRIKLFPINNTAMFMNTSGGIIKNQPLTSVDLLTLFKGSKVLCFFGNFLITFIISSYFLFFTCFIGLFKYFNVDFTAHIIFLSFGFLDIVLLTYWYYSIKHNKTVFCILSMISIGANFSAYNVIKWIWANRHNVDQFNSTSYSFYLMLIGCCIFIMATVSFQMLSFVWKRIKLEHYLKSFYLIISTVLFSSGFIMLSIYLAANSNKLTSSIKFSIYILLIGVFFKIILVILEYLVHWAVLKYLSEIVLWCLPLQSGSVCIDVYISLLKCSQSNCKSLPFTIIFGNIIIFFGSLLLLYWKIFRSSRFSVKHLSQSYGIHHLNIDGGYEPFSTIRNNLYVYPVVTISVTLLSFAYIILVMMVISMMLSTLLNIIITNLLLKKIGIELDVIISCLRRIKYRCKKVMSYKLSIFTLLNSPSSSSSYRNKNKRINIINLEEDEESDDQNNDEEYENEDEDENNDDYYRKQQYHIDFDTDNYYDYHTINIKAKKKEINKVKENQKNARFINQFKHQVNDLINVNFMNKKMKKKQIKKTKPRIYYEKLFKSIPIIIYGIGLLFLFSGLLIGYKSKFSMLIFDDLIYLESETYTLPHSHWILFFVAVGAYAFITIEYLCINFQFFKSLSLLLTMLTYYFSGILIFSFYRLSTTPETNLKVNPHYSKDLNKKLMRVSSSMTLTGIFIINGCITLFYILKFINWVAFSTSHPEYTEYSKKKRRLKICCSIDMKD